MKERLVVDGYNVIHAWQELRQLAGESLQLARERLVDRLGTLSLITGTDVTVVFDAHHTTGSPGAREQKGGVEVVFTPSGSSADHVIERLAYAARADRESLLVATSDRFHGDMLRGLGAAVIDVRELERQVAEAERELARQLLRYGR